MEDETLGEMYALFGDQLRLSHRLEYIINRRLEPDGLTTKQFMVLAALVKAFDAPPSVMEVAREIGTTHQNVKQIALKLVSKGFIELERDPSDRRVLRMRVTEANEEYWSSREAENEALITSLFRFLDREELDALYLLTRKLLAGVDGVYDELRVR